MVQQVAPTSTYACIVDPIVNSSPYQLISRACSAIRALAQRIMNFVSSIFTVIVNFVKSCFCGAAAATTPLAPRNSALVGPVPVAPTGSDPIQEGKAFLAHLLNPIVGDFGEAELLALMQNEEHGNAFLANMLVYDLVMNTDSVQGQPLPFMVTQGMALTSITFISKVENLREAFAALDPAPGVSGREPVDAAGPVASSVRTHFAAQHLTTNIPIPDDTAIIPADVFDDNPDNAGSDANVFYARLNKLARNFVIANFTFGPAANELRAEYIRNHLTH